MVGRIKNLDNLRVASPCQTDWDAMAGDERTRFCLECNKNVHNLSAMTRQQAASLISERQGKLCARFSLRPDGTLITLEPTAAASRAPRGRASRVVAAAAFTALFSFCASVFAQQTPTTRAGESPAQLSQQDVKPANRQRTNDEREKTAKLHGTIYDFEKSVVPQAKVTLVKESTQQERIVETNDEGVFIIADLEDGLYTLVAEFPGFTPFVQQLRLRAGEDKLLNVTLQLGLMGEIIVVEQPVVQNPALSFIIETLSAPYRGIRKIVKADPR
jgi:hypothetical protein